MKYLSDLRAPYSGNAKVGGGVCLEPPQKYVDLIEAVWSQAAEVGAIDLSGQGLTNIRMTGSLERALNQRLDADNSFYLNISNNNISSENLTAFLDSLLSWVQGRGQTGISGELRVEGNGVPIVESYPRSSLFSLDIEAAIATGGSTRIMDYDDVLRWQLDFDWGVPFADSFLGVGTEPTARWRVGTADSPPVGAVIDWLGANNLSGVVNGSVLTFSGPDPLLDAPFKLGDNELNVGLVDAGERYRPHGVVGLSANWGDQNMVVSYEEYVDVYSHGGPTETRTYGE